MSWSGWRFDLAWQWLFVLMMVSTGLAALLSGADLAFIGRAARAYPVQLMAAIGGIVLGGFIAYVIYVSIPDALQVIVGVVVVFGPGWLLSTIYAKKKG